MTRRRNRPTRAYSEQQKADPNVAVVVSQQGVAAPAQMPRNMRAYIQEGYRSNKTVFRVVGHIARAGAGIKWKHYTDESKKREVPNSDLLKLWNNPSPRISGTAFREAMLAYYCMTGNSYLLGINAKQSPTAPFDELYNLRPDLTKIKMDEQGPLYYEFGNFSPPRRYQQPYVMHNKLFAGNDDVYGMSPVEVAAMLVDIQKAGQKWNLGLLSNMARPGGAWVTDALLGDTEYKSLKEEIRRKFAGPRNAGETAILHGGVKWQSMSMSPYELDWLESDTKSDRDIAGIFFNFPLFLLGLADSTYSNQAEARYALYTEIEFPLLDLFQDSLNMWLTPRYGGYLGYDQEDVEAIRERLQAAMAAASERATAEFIASTTTFHEAREIQGRPKLAVKDFVLINQIPVHVEDLDDYIAAMSGKTINPPPPPPQLLPPPTTTVTEIPDDTTDDLPADDTPPGKAIPYSLSIKIRRKRSRILTKAVINGEMPTYNRWVCDGNPCATCLDNGGIILNTGDTFPSGDTEPPVHPHCQCGLEDASMEEALVAGSAEWLDSLSTDEKDALLEYSDREYHAMNSILRTGSYEDFVDGGMWNKAYEDKLIADARDALVRSTAPVDLVLSRAVESDMLATFRENTGAYFTDKGFVSMTANASSNLGEVQISITVAKGSPGGYIASLSNQSSEKEFLLPPGASFKVVSVSTDSDGISHVVMEYDGTLTKQHMHPLLHKSTRRILHPDKFIWHPGDIEWAKKSKADSQHVELDSKDDTEEGDIEKVLTKYISTLPQLEVTREQYRELLRAKR